MLLLLVLGMLVVLLVLLEELVVFEGGIFKKVISPNFFFGKIKESKKIFFGADKN